MTKLSVLYLQLSPLDSHPSLLGTLLDLLELFSLLPNIILCTP